MLSEHVSSGTVVVVLLPVVVVLLPVIVVLLPVVVVLLPVVVVAVAVVVVLNRSKFGGQSFVASSRTEHKPESRL